ncbi:MAG: Gfo/Idh/MocA family oxidoreductase [Dactylosporangium sp.]|nr:Gfo/Idh/MocA family oxidoreductase [Dactylosporangium sp.]NNJ61802.1 Gfo/Idh/MocA family oxidoreductase [Dactylosporangium sp.]
MNTSERLPAVVVGAGKWAHEYWVPFLHRQRVLTVVAVADIHAPARASLATHLNGVATFTTLEHAVAHLPQLTVAVILTSPESHAELITTAHRLGLDVITEKPAATNLDDLRLLRGLPPDYRAVVCQNYRYEAHIQTLRNRLRAGDLGQVRSVHARFAADYRQPGSWDVGDAHTMVHPMLLEGSIHHLDMMRYLTGADITRVVTSAHNPPGSSFVGHALVHCLLEFTDGTLGTYEASLLCAGREQRWHHEYYRLECDNGAIECDGWQVRILRGTHVEPVETTGDPSRRDGHLDILAQYQRWRHGGPVAETALADNLHSLAIVMAAIESAQTGGWCDVSSPRFPGDL